MAILILAASISAVLCYVLIRWASQLPFSKQPSTDRWHTQVTPDSGGLAVFVSLAAVYLAFFRGQHVVAAVAAAALWLLGTLDDRLRFRARTKFMTQALVVTLALAGGVVMHVSPWPPLNWALSWLWLMGITNAFNLIDNMDGLAAGVAVIIAAFRGISLYARGELEAALLSGVIAAAFAGFLLFNLRPARIFMGDGGSLLAGFSLAALAINGPERHARGMPGLVCAALIFAYPIFDTTLVSIVRRASGRPISVGGRDHSSHRMAANGMHETAVVSTLWVFTALGCATGVLLNRVPAAVMVIFSLFFVFAAFFGVFLGTLVEPALPSQPGARALPPKMALVKAGVTGILDALMTALVGIACLMRCGLPASDSQWAALVLAAPLVMLIHAVASALACSYQHPWGGFQFSAFVTWTRIAILIAAIAGLMQATGNYPRGQELWYAVTAFALGAGLRAAFQSWRRAAALLRSHFEKDPRPCVAIYPADADGQALARFLRDAKSFGMRPAAFLDDACAGSSVEGLPVACAHRDWKRLRKEWKVATVILLGPARYTESGRALQHFLEHAGFSVATLDVQASPGTRPSLAAAESVAVLV